MNRPPAVLLLASTLTVCLLSSCSLPGLRKHVETLEVRGGITVQVVPPPRGGAPTYALV
ncbi:MAG TPA: hypothetical protein VK956_09370 [Verrucomicrobium sp.]|nr:hypothetical protein [Verrucomicrobium sp.]